MKDENKGTPMTDFVGLRSKLYTTKVLVTARDVAKQRQKLSEQGYDEDEIDNIAKNLGIGKKAKGIMMGVIRNEITFDDFLSCLENWREKIVTQNLIKADKHQVYSISQDKVAPGSYNTLPWGHYSITKPVTEDDYEQYQMEIDDYDQYQMEIDD
jgi:hypothetical protein